MIFSSISFLYYFLAACLLVYFLVPSRLKNLVLLLFSLAFYFYGEPVYTLLMLASTLSAYVHGLLIDRTRGTKWSRVLLWSSVVTSIGLLGFFKYSDFFISNVNSLFSSNIPLLRLALPIGISFYTFQTLSYTIDVYRGDAKVQKSFIRLATYVTLFPQLIAGPIVRYTTVEQELSDRKHSFEGFAAGVNRFVIGLAKKVLIADTLGLLIKDFTASSDRSIVFAWVYAIAASLQLYFDFSGYSDMAIGLGRLFGFHFLENFNYPFISKSITEFWRRWHMSLGQWFRDYVYIPLGGNRVSTWRWIRNIFVVWLLTGFWHGADWTFIFWGLLHGLYSVITRHWKHRIDAMPKLTNWLCTFLFLNVTWVFFRADTIADGFEILKRAIAFDFGPICSNVTSAFNLTEITLPVMWLLNIDLNQVCPYLMTALAYIVVFLVSVFSSNAYERMNRFDGNLWNMATTVILLVWCIFSLSGISTFLYFNF